MVGVLECPGIFRWEPLDSATCRSTTTTNDDNNHNHHNGDNSDDNHNHNEGHGWEHESGRRGQGLETQSCRCVTNPQYVFFKLFLFYYTSINDYFQLIRPSVWKSGLLPFLVYFWARTLPSKFPIIIEVLEHKILGLVRLISGLITGNFSFLGTPVSMKKINGNVPAAKLPKKAKDRTFKH